MRNYYINKIPLIALAVCFSQSTNAFTSAEQINDREKKTDFVTERQRQMDRLYGVTPEYDWEEDQRNIAGTDNNNDGVRDALLKITKSFVFIYPDVTKAQFNELYQLAIDIQPPAGPKFERIKSEKEFQCRYAKISSSIGLDAPYKEFRDTIIFGSNKRSSYWHTIKPIKTDDYQCDIEFEFQR